jgi:hypothetical protein
LGAEYQNRGAGCDELAFFGEPTQHRAIVRRDDRRIAPIELRGSEPGLGHRCLRLEILQLLEADDTVCV